MGAKASGEVHVGWLAFGYFAAYVPYAALTKSLSSGTFPGVGRAIAGFELLPVTAIASLLGMYAFFTFKGLWKHAGRRRLGPLEFPAPSGLLLISGLCTSAVIVTTTLAYTFEGVSIVLMMLFMRGGVLLIAPVVDLMSRRKVRWFSWIALGLSVAALLVGVRSDNAGVTTMAIVDLAVYLAAYFIRLRLMSQLAKSADPTARLRFFVEEQMVATPALVLALTGMALFGPAAIAAPLTKGFLELPLGPAFLPSVIAGLCSQGTGIFGGLVLLDPRENSWTVPLNRAASVLAGLIATAVLWAWAGGKAPPMTEFFGALLVLSAVAMLSLPEWLSKRRAAGA